MIPRRKIAMFKGEKSLLLRSVLGMSASFGADVDAWEKQFAAYCGVEHGIAVSSGRKGMEMIFKSLDLRPGDEVIIPAYTLKALVPFIQKLGLVPVAADLDPASFNISPEDVARRISEKTRVILVCHLFGNPCCIEQIVSMAREKNIFVLEDCAHSAGSFLNGKHTGSFGDAAFFSFETIKPINTYGGGMIVTSNTELAKNIRSGLEQLDVGQCAEINRKKAASALVENVVLPSPLSFPMLYMLASPKWCNLFYRLYRNTQNASIQYLPYSRFQAGLGVEKLKTLKDRVERKNALAKEFCQMLPDWVCPQKVLDGALHNYYFFVARVKNRDVVMLRRHLLLRGIDAGIKAEIADDCAPFLEQDDCPVSRDVFGGVIHLPFYESLTTAKMRRIVRALESFR